MRFRQDLSAKFDIVQPSEATLSKSETLRTNGEKVEFKDGIITGLGIWVRKEPLAEVLDDEVAVELRLMMDDY